jgi:hypothetical protein
LTLSGVLNILDGINERTGQRCFWTVRSATRYLVLVSGCCFVVGLMLLMYTQLSGVLNILDGINERTGQRCFWTVHSATHFDAASMSRDRSLCNVNTPISRSNHFTMLHSLQTNAAPPEAHFDAAFLRPGRMDMMIDFTKCNGGR